MPQEDNQPSPTSPPPEYSPDQQDQSHVPRRMPTALIPHHAHAPIPHTFALAAFQSPSQLDRLVSALARYDTAQRVSLGQWNVYPGTDFQYQILETSDVPPPLRPRGGRRTTPLRRIVSPPTSSENEVDVAVGGVKLTLLDQQKEETGKKPKVEEGEEEEEGVKEDQGVKQAEEGAMMEGPPKRFGILPALGFVEEVEGDKGDETPLGEEDEQGKAEPEIPNPDNAVKKAKNKDKKLKKKERKVKKKEEQEKDEERQREKEPQEKKEKEKEKKKEREALAASQAKENQERAKEVAERKDVEQSLLVTTEAAEQNNVDSGAVMANNASTTQGHDTFEDLEDIMAELPGSLRDLLREETVKPSEVGERSEVAEKDDRIGDAERPEGHALEEINRMETNITDISATVTPAAPFVPLPSLPDTTDGITTASATQSPISVPFPFLIVQTGEASFDLPGTKTGDGHEQEIRHEVKVRLPHTGSQPHLEVSTPQQLAIQDKGDQGVRGSDKENIPQSTNSMLVDYLPLEMSLTPPLSPESSIASDSLPQTIITPASPPMISSPTLSGMSRQSALPSMIDLIPDRVPQHSHDEPDPLPLSHAWSLYHSFTGSPVPLTAAQMESATPIIFASRNQNAEAYSHGLFLLFTASTVQELLGTWKALRRKIAYSRGRSIEAQMAPIRPSNEGLGVGFLPDDTNFHFFLQDVQPMWEDEMCRDGGKIMISGNNNMMDAAFLQVILLLAGGTFEDECPAPLDSSCAVVGTVLSRRKINTRIEVWLGARNQRPDFAWIKRVEAYIMSTFEGHKSYHYRPFRQAKGV